MNNSDAATEIPASNNKKQLFCSLCNKDFQWKSGLSRHIKLFHLQNKAKNYKCEVCHKLFTKQIGLRIHLKRHVFAKNSTVKKKYSEMYATPAKEIVYSSDSDCEYEVVKTGIKLNSAFSSFECKLCSAKFYILANLERHSFNKHNDNGSSVSKLKKTAKLATRPGRYRKNHSIEDSTHFDSHILTHKNSDDVTDDGETEQLFGSKIFHEYYRKPYLCMICGKVYSRAGCLSIHMRSHNDFRPHLCNVCGKTFTTKRYLMMHLRTHSNDKPYKCQHCSKEFVQKGNLVEHLRIHTGLKPYNCSACRKSFTHYSGLAQHILTHSPVKKNICEICGKTFRRPAHYREHLRTHSGDKPFVCTFCERAFANSSSLIVHLRTHTGERPFKCNVCQKGFIKNYGLKQHKKTHASCNISDL